MPIEPSKSHVSSVPWPDITNLTADALSALLQSTSPPALQVMLTLREALHAITRNAQRSSHASGLLGASSGEVDPRVAWDALRAWAFDDDVPIENLWAAFRAREIPAVVLGKGKAILEVASQDIYTPPAEPVTDIRTKFWHEVRDHMERDAPPSLQAMRMLRQLLFQHTQNRTTSAEIAALLGQPTGTPNSAEAWKALRNWMTDEVMSVREVAALFAVQDTTVSDAPISGARPVVPVVARPASPVIPAQPVVKPQTMPAKSPQLPPPPVPEVSPPTALDTAASSTPELMRQLRDAWTRQAVVPSAEVQRFLISLILNNHVPLRDETTQTELRQIQSLLNANEPQKTAEAWDNLRVWAKRRVFTDREFRMRLSHFSSPSPKAESTDDVIALASPAHRNVYKVLMQICTLNGNTDGMRTATSLVRYPPQLPRQWLDDGVPTVFTVARARLNGWKVVDLMDSRFIVPPTEILQYLLAPTDYTHLVDFGIAAAESVPTTTSGTTSRLDDLSGKLAGLLPRTDVLLDKSNRTIHLPHEFEASPVTNESVFHAISKGATLIYLRGELYLLPLSAIGQGDAQISGEELLKLNTFGVIGLRGGPASPWWHLRDNDALNSADPFALLREPAAGELDFTEFATGQLSRWSGEVRPVIDLNQYPWLKAYPEMSKWLRKHLSHLEPLDMKLLESYLSCAEHAVTTETITGVMNLIQGVMGEIAIRPQIVESYQAILRTHPKAILAVAPQIHSGDIREASDAVVFEIVQNGDAITVHLLSAWEVTTHEGGISAEKRKLDRALTARYAELGVHFRGNDGRGVSFPLEHSIGDTDAQVQRVERSNDFMTVVQTTTEQITTRFGQHEWNTNDHGMAIARGAERVEKVTPHVEMALSRGYTYEEFDKALAAADPDLATIFRNMTRPPLGQRRMGVELEAVMSLSSTTISRWEALFAEICQGNEWTVAARNAKAEAVVQGKLRRKAAGPVLEQARSGTFATPQELYPALVATDPIGAAVFKNMTHPDGGIRASQKQLARQAGVKSPSIQNREKQIAKLCKDRGWEIIPMSGQSLASHTAKTSSATAKKFIEKAKAGTISLSDFLAQLSAISKTLGMVFENMVAPVGSIRLRPATLKDTVGLNNNSIGIWEKLFVDLCNARGWLGEIKPLQPIADAMKAAKQSHGRQKLLDDLRTLSELHDGRPLTEADLDPALGVAGAKVYKDAFGSLDNALVEAGLMPRPMPKLSERGYVTVGVLAAPLLAPIEGARQLINSVRANAAQINKAATQTLRGGAVFFLGSLGADVVEGLRTGDWNKIKQMSPLGFARTYTGLTVGGEIGKQVSTAAVSLIPTRIMPVPVKGVIVRGGAMAVGLTAAQWLASGKVDLKQIPHDLAVCLGASAIVKGATAVLGRSALLQGVSSVMKLTKAGKLTFLGAVATSIAEFTVMNEITRLELRAANRPNIDSVRAHILTLLRADVEIQRALQSGVNVDGRVVDQIGNQFEDLARLLAAAPDVDGQIVEMEHDTALQEAEEARVIAEATGNPDATWNALQHVRRLERKRNAHLADIRDAEMKASQISLMEASEFQEMGDDAVGLSMAANATALDSSHASSFSEILGGSYHSLSRQIADYLRYRKERLALATGSMKVASN